MTDDRRTTVVAASPDVVIATAWRDLLRDEGIRAELFGAEVHQVYPGAASSDFRVIVFEDDAARARELIDRAEAGELSLPDEG